MRTFVIEKWDEKLKSLAMDVEFDSCFRVVR